MSDVAIKVENLSKLYRIGVEHQKSDTFVSNLVKLFTAPISNFKRIKNLSNFKDITDDPSIFAALSDINFEVKKGEILAIAGHNGAGKSTLLKILSRITEPTSGQIEINGRVSSLLEVGTGFHPELTGRENIYMNGTILGMRKKEIDRKLDEIIAFSGISKHIDTPVKFYSSGMKVRLGFSVAAHLEPEILIIDEVLAVGDVAFQKKCLGKMDDVAHSGKTILFVSHNMQAVRALCNSGLLLKGGTVFYRGSVEETTILYDKTLREQDFTNLAELTSSDKRRGLGTARFNAIDLVDSVGSVRNYYDYKEDIILKARVKIFEDMPTLFFSWMLRSGYSGEPVASSLKHKIGNNLKAGEEFEFEIKFQNILRPGEYPVYFWLGDASLNPIDVIDGITPPLVITSKMGIEVIGFDPSVNSGVITLEKI
ncbi:MAG TPA: hypothetical protein DCQ29_11035 [Chitinophagaceae bacterium]|nr:hypothetical protein [Chitinophagaceae bacterium]